MGKVRGVGLDPTLELMINRALRHQAMGMVDGELSRGTLVEDGVVEDGTARRVTLHGKVHQTGDDEVSFQAVCHLRRMDEGSLWEPSSILLSTVPERGALV